jgi:tetratricopeptide (TPR) repeat protein
MKLLRRAGASLLLASALAVAYPPARAVESDPLPVPTGTPREKAVIAYNEGVALLLDKRYAAAQAKFEAALAQDEKLAEAHNNLAFALRMQGAQNFERSLRHYDRALELKPDLAQAYMYRGVLFTQMGDTARARADHQRLLALDPDLAAQLDAVIVGRARGYGRAGIAAQFE